MSVSDSVIRVLAGVGKQSRRYQLLAGVALIAILTLILANTLSEVNIYVLNAVLLACMGAIALNVLMGVAGQVSIGNAAFLGVGGFTAVYVSSHGVPFPVDVILAAVVSGIAGFVVGLPALRIRGLYLALATLAAQFVVTFIGNKYEATTNMTSGFQLKGLYNSFGYVAAQKYWAYTLALIVIVVVVLASAYTHGKTGRALRIIRDHEVIAPMLGIKVTRYKLLTFALASAVIGAEGALTGHLIGNVSVDNYTLTIAIQYLAMILIGGLDSMVGAVIGATVVISLPVVVPKLLTGVLGDTATNDGAQIAQIIYGALVVLFIVTSPGGIIGWLRARRVQLWRLLLKSNGAHMVDPAAELVPATPTD